MNRRRCARLLLGIGVLLTLNVLLSARQSAEPPQKTDKGAMPPNVPVPGLQPEAVVALFAFAHTTPVTAQLLWATLQGLPPPSTGDDKGGPKEPPPPKPPTVTRYVEVLKSDQELVRKWAIKVLVEMGPMGREAIPAMLEVARADPSPAIKRQARAVVATYKAVDLAEQLSKVLRNPSANPEWRKIACTMLPGLYRDAPLETSLKDDVRKALEEAVADQDPVGSSRVDLQACKLEYSIVSPK